MEPEIKLCQNCKKEFTIEPEDFKFYEKMQVLAPTWCPECRLVRRLSFINTWSLHWRNCDVCKEKTLSEYPPEDQVKELSDKTPYVALESQYSTLKNSEYSNSIAWSKDCFQVFWADYCEFVYYSSILNGLKFSSDCLRGWESELCYESTG